MIDFCYNADRICVTNVLENCKSCPDEIACASCIDGYYINLDKTKCIASCPEGQCADDTTMACLDSLSVHCSNCTNSGAACT